MNFDPIQLATAADAEAIDRIMQFTTRNLTNRDWFFDDDIHFIRRHLGSAETAGASDPAAGLAASAESFPASAGAEGYTLKYMVEGEIAGFLIIRYPGGAADNLGRYLDLTDAQLATVAHMESVCVLPQYRGHRIFQQLMQRALDMERAKGRTRYFMGTAHPDNQYSMNVFTHHGFGIAKTIRKYDNWLRNVLLLQMNE